MSLNTPEYNANYYKENKGDIDDQRKKQRTPEVKAKFIAYKKEWRERKRQEKLLAEKRHAETLANADFLGAEIVNHDK